MKQYKQNMGRLLYFVKFATGHRYFLSFAKTYYSIVALPEHTISPKMENSLKTVPRIVIPSKLLNFFFCNALANVIQNYNGTRQSHN
jgi:hypothetical protein